MKLTPETLILLSAMLSVVVAAFGYILIQIGGTWLAVSVAVIVVTIAAAYTGAWRK